MYIDGVCYSRVVEEIPFDPWTEENAARNNKAMDRLLKQWEAEERYEQAEAARLAAETPLAERAIAYLAKCPPAVSGQKGHNALLNAARAVVYGFDLGQDTGFDLLKSHYNPACQPPWSDTELRHKCKEADTKPFDKPRGYLLNEEAGNSHQNGYAAGHKNGSTPRGGPLPPRDVAEADVATIADLVSAGSEVRWLWEGWLQVGVVNALAAEGGKGKTRFCADLLRRIRHGLPWPDGQAMTLPPETRSLWVLADNHHDEMVNLSAAFGIQDVIWLNAPKKDPYAGVTLETAEDMRDLEGRIKAIQPALVIVDTVGNATDKNLSKQEDAKAFYQPLQIIARKYRCAVLCLTHLNAGGKFLGRRVLEKVRVAVRMEKPDVSDDRRRLEVYKSNSKTPPPLGVTMLDSSNEYDTNPPESSEYGEGQEKAVSPQLQKAVDWLRGQLRFGQRRVSEVRRMADGDGIAANTLYRAKDVLKVREDGPKGHLTWELPQADEVEIE